MTRSRHLLVLALLLAGCAGNPEPIRPSVDPGRFPADPGTGAAAAPAPAPLPVAPPDAAFAAGWMPLASTGADRFLRAWPSYDGRGVLIAILDSGLDPTIPGLEWASTGERKVLDLRDFSGEGRVALEPIPATADSVRLGGSALGGLARVRAFSTGGPWYAGRVAERALGPLPASDLDGNGSEADTLVVVTARGSDGWLMFADTDRDGTLLDERPVRDYLAGGETFCWHGPGRPCPLGVGVNLREEAGAPVLDLVFDTSGHGSHVAGIAAGRDIYGVAGFHGVAPGATLLGLKIADNANGGISTTGAIRAAMAYAVRTARQRRLPLVINLSFGVGNEQEGRARIDAVVDSVLAANPDVVMTISAGNDGPGLSTLGFPGSADRAISVGATFPTVFVQRSARAASVPDPVAFFSSRGGELAKPDLVTPGVAYSTVPAWDVGEERNAGTSMASPHAAGLAALLVSALAARGTTPDAARIKRALMVTALSTPGASWIDEGAGVPDVGLAWEWLEAGHAAAEARVTVPGSGAPAAFHATPPPARQAFELTLPPGSTPIRVRFQSDAPWIVAPAAAALREGTTRVEVAYRRDRLLEPGAHVGVVTAWGGDTAAGPVARLVSTVIVPLPSRDTVIGPLALGPGEVRRWFLPAEPDRPFEVGIATTGPFQAALTSLHEPGGMPWREENGRPAGPGEDAATYQVDARDVRPGLYEVDAIAPPGASASVQVRVARSPVRLEARLDGGMVEARFRNASDSTVALLAGAALLGAELAAPAGGIGGHPVRLPVPVPGWATRVAVEVAMDPVQWDRFTDLGATLLAEDGRQLLHQPLNYHVGRLVLEPGDTLSPGGEAATLALFPGLADSSDTRPWEVSVRVRFYAAEPAFLSPETPGRLSLGREGSATARFALPPAPWPLPPGGYDQLGVVWAEAGDGIWTREVLLAPAVQP
ncbi:MAG TPA: S8 family serine peptidase [Gemmatimonadales bacterium]|nr:S8 family serine peptidase [Gemmatimonadales bacterium]